MSGKLLNTINISFIILIQGVMIRRFNPFSIGVQGWFHTSANLDAARKGTREKARKRKVKVEVKKIGFIPHNERERDK